MAAKKLYYTNNNIHLKNQWSNKKPKGTVSSNTDGNNCYNSNEKENKIDLDAEYDENYTVGPSLLSQKYSTENKNKGKIVTPMLDIPQKFEFQESSNRSMEFEDENLDGVPPNFVVSEAESQSGSESESESEPGLSSEEEDTCSGEEKLNSKDKVGNNSNSEETETETVESTKQNSLRNQPSSCVFVASLAATLTDEELSNSVTNHFAKYGDLKMVKVLRDGKNRPYAFVQYTNDSDATRALKEAHGSKLDGRELRCERARVNRTLHISSKIQLNDEFIKTMCMEFGQLEQVIKGQNNNPYIRRNNYLSNMINSWFVRFVYRDDAIRAFANIRSNPNLIVNWVQNVDIKVGENLLNNDEIQDSPNTKKSDSNSSTLVPNSISPSSISRRHSWLDDCGKYSNRFNPNWSISNSLSNNPIKVEELAIDKKSIFVGQLSNDATEENLKERFSTHGEITNFTLIRKPTNIFAFIEFKTEASAASAFEKENHAIFLNKTMHVQYKEISRSRRSFSNSNNKNFPANDYKKMSAPQINLAPPPINVYRRHSIDPTPIVPHYMANSLPRIPSFGVNPYLPYNNYSTRRKSMPDWSTVRSFKSDLDSNTTANTISDNNNNSNMNADSSSEISTTSASKSTTGAMYDNSFSGNTNSNTTTSNSGINGENYRKNFNYKRNNNYKYSINDPNRSYYYSQYYFQPMNYPMNPMGGNFMPNNNSPTHPYMMFCPMPPPTGVDPSMFVPRMNNSNPMMPANMAPSNDPMGMHSSEDNPGNIDMIPTGDMITEESPIQNLDY
ncbi:hypothetical protein TBLA_0A08550 [Henningerozyma blattae CBS 6284]|uniref:RRM domain-containing protein n=1 Tax=Henningerozyma blattae (strain ATCC 34711 / CBS 6284 / DSM 70876 / NBRC 10599 / NRRL Y-10934 / UCD 77-7) TaxID=1071380 RepID=I2GWZ3_HENB6|nr:hypothetical protein TBLA_0A08550 [Tetrapisispora blattae CBS 6284]CCH58645.1 hypothetical protein TBLA_0A08550 [Tetrapisispora blattae CBS 6284]